MAKIRITVISDQVKLPEWVKQAFLGLVLPLVNAPEDQKSALYSSDFYGAGIPRGKVPKSAFYVEVKIVLKILRKKNPKAAEWLADNIVDDKCSGWIGFTQEECTLVT